MQKEIEIPASERYLVCNHSFTELTLEKIKVDVKQFMSAKDKDECYWQFMNWHKKKSEIAVLTMYAYANISLPIKFDTLFHIEEPSNCLSTEFLITQAIFNGWAPLNQISQGHKHIAILQFDDAVPHLFNSLPVFGDKTLKINPLQLGFCNKVDYVAIRNKLMTALGQ